MHVSTALPPNRDNPEITYNFSCEYVTIPDGIRMNNFKISLDIGRLISLGFDVRSIEPSENYGSGFILEVENRLYLASVYHNVPLLEWISQEFIRDSSQTTLQVYNELTGFTFEIPLNLFERISVAGEV